MKLHIGTSGYSYKEWKGPFYPEKLSATKMLSFYATRLNAVEINNTFYRLPNANVLTRWGEEVPPGFTFVIKVPRRISHEKRLNADAVLLMKTLLGVTEALGDHLGPFLIQLPPFLRRDPELLRQFLGEIPDANRLAFEFRHESWFDAGVYEVLEKAGAALCQADTDEKPVSELVATSDWGYLRLRGQHYEQQDLERWAERISAQRWKRAFVFFKHEEGGVGPNLAAALSKLLGST